MIVSTSYGMAGADLAGVLNLNLYIAALCLSLKGKTSATSRNGQAALDYFELKR